MKIIARHDEQKRLSSILKSKKPEFVAVYGRRRIGKTYLIKEFFSHKKVIFFKVTGIKNAPLSQQIRNFTDQLGDTFYSGASLKAESNWHEALLSLTHAIKQIPEKQRVVLFFDEFPWMAHKNSNLLQQLEYFWNQYWSSDKRLKLIICGSAASWILEKIIFNKDGLYNRVTESLHLEPFNLAETKQFLSQRGIKLNYRHTTDIYMAIGGIPFYLNKIEKGLSATQAIERLAFRKKSFMLDEFETLYSSLFNDHETHINIIKMIASKRYGISQKDLLAELPSSQRGRSGLSKLNALEQSGFITSFTPHFNKAKGIHYLVTDEFTMFYLKWIEPVKNSLLKQSLRKGYWDKMHDTPAWKSCSGYAFESICYKHISQIAQALELNPIAIPATWRYVPKKGSKDVGAQIDLLFDRPDDVITICEIKHTVKPFKIDKEVAKGLQQKCEVFQKRTKTEKQLLIAMITDAGIKPSMYSEEMVDAVVKLKDFFVKVD